MTALHEPFKKHRMRRDVTVLNHPPTRTAYEAFLEQQGDPFTTDGAVEGSRPPGTEDAPFNVVRFAQEEGKRLGVDLRIYRKRTTGETLWRLEVFGKWKRT